MWIALFACVVLSSPSGQARDPVLQRALQRYGELEYEAALPLLERSLARSGLDAADRRLALAYLGRTRAVLRDADGAVEAFAELLAIEPDFAVPAIESPLIREALAQARTRVPAAPAPTFVDAASVDHGTARPPPVAGQEVVPHGVAAPAVAPAIDDTAPTPAPGPAPVAASPRASATTPDRAADGGDEVPAWLYAGGALLAGGALVASAAVATWLLWPQAPPAANLGRWELP